MQNILICDIVVWENVICQYSAIFSFISESQVKLANKTEIKRYNSINKKHKKN
jgi:hypothetical protein